MAPRLVIRVQAEGVKQTQSEIEEVMNKVKMGNPALQQLNVGYKDLTTAVINYTRNAKTGAYEATTSLTFSAQQATNSFRTLISTMQQVGSVAHTIMSLYTSWAVWQIRYWQYQVQLHNATYRLLALQREAINIGGEYGVQLMQNVKLYEQLYSAQMKSAHGFDTVRKATQEAIIAQGRFGPSSIAAQDALAEWQDAIVQWGQQMVSIGVPLDQVNAVIDRMAQAISTGVNPDYKKIGEEVGWNTAKYGRLGTFGATVNDVLYATLNNLKGAVAETIPIQSQIAKNTADWGMEVQQAMISLKEATLKVQQTEQEQAMMFATMAVQGIGVAGSVLQIASNVALIASVFKGGGGLGALFGGGTSSVLTGAGASAGGSFLGSAAGSALAGGGGVTGGLLAKAGISGIVSGVSSTVGSFSTGLSLSSLGLLTASGEAALPAGALAGTGAAGLGIATTPLTAAALMALPAAWGFAMQRKQLNEAAEIAPSIEAAKKASGKIASLRSLSALSPEEARTYLESLKQQVATEASTKKLVHIGTTVSQQSGIVSDELLTELGKAFASVYTDQKKASEAAREYGKSIGLNENKIKTLINVTNDYSRSLDSFKKEDNEVAFKDLKSALDDMTISFINTFGPSDKTLERLKKMAEQAGLTAEQISYLSESFKLVTNAETSVAEKTLQEHATTFKLALESGTITQAQYEQAMNVTNSQLSKVRELDKLLKQGIITQEDYNYQIKATLTPTKTATKNIEDMTGALKTSNQPIKTYTESILELSKAVTDHTMDISEAVDKIMELNKVYQNITYPNAVTETPTSQYGSSTGTGGVVSSYGWTYQYTSASAQIDALLSKKQDVITAITNKTISMELGQSYLNTIDSQLRDLGYPGASSNTSASSSPSISVPKSLQYQMGAIGLRARGGMVPRTGEYRLEAGEVVSTPGDVAVGKVTYPAIEWDTRNIMKELLSSVEKTIYPEKELGAFDTIKEIMPSTSQASRGETIINNTYKFGDIKITVEHLNSDVNIRDTAYKLRKYIQTEVSR